MTGCGGSDSVANCVAMHLGVHKTKSAAGVSAANTGRGLRFGRALRMRDFCEDSVRNLLGLCQNFVLCGAKQ
eukprot:1158968-Pelagomonas_calceolata.AAC.3